MQTPNRLAGLQAQRQALRQALQHSKLPQRTLWRIYTQLQGIRRWRMATYLKVFSSPNGEIETMRAYQAVLDQWPVPYTELDISTSFGETHVISSGPDSAPPVILLHAYFATATSWYRTVDALSRHYRTYAVDIIGEANKSRPTRPVKSMDDFLCWFKELVDGMGISQMYLVGNSFGGFTGAYYAMHLPDRIRKLALIGPAATIHQMPAFYIHMFMPKAAYLLFPRLPGIARTMRRSVDWVHAGLPYDPLWEKLFYSVMMYGGATNQVFPRVYSAEEFAQIKAPTLLILGDREKIYPPGKAAEQAKRLMPDIRVQMIPAAHHITAIAQPEPVNQSLLQFFEEDGI
jgi:pimeloyl-ACP methyl ester carboxylesterase